MDNQQEATNLEVVSGDALNAIERGQVDIQISTAKKYPRSIKQFLDEAKSMIGINQETAEGCNYRLKRKGRDGVKIIEGPSIRLLEIAASAYTNLRYGSRVIGIDAQFVTAQGVAFDLQKNVSVTVETKRAIADREGRRYSLDMIMVTSNAAGAIARRNALNGLVPRAYIVELAAWARQIAVGDLKSLKDRRQKAFEYFTVTLGVELEKVLAYLEKPSIEDCGLPEVEELQGLKTMLRDGEISMESAFPDVVEKGESPDLSGQKKPDLVQPVPQNQGSVPAKQAPVPQTTPPVQAPAQTQTPPAEPAAAAQAPRKRAAKAEPQPPVETPPAAEQTPASPTPETPPGPVLSLVERADMLDQKLAAEGVEVGEFFDWCKSSGRDRKYKFKPDDCATVADAPEQLIDDLSASDYAGLAPCVRTFGTAAKQRAKV